MEGLTINDTAYQMLGEMGTKTTLRYLLSAAIEPAVVYGTKAMIFDRYQMFSQLPCFHRIS